MEINITAGLEFAKKYGFYVYPENVNSIRRIFHNEEVSIFMQEGLMHNLRFFPQTFGENSHILATVCHWTYPEFFGLNAQCIDLMTDGKYNKKNITILANTQEQVDQCLAAGFDAIFCNHNCWLDENIFKINKILDEKVYNLVMNSRPEKIKNPELVMGIEGLAIIQGNNHNKEDFWDLNQLNPAYINEKRIGVDEVVDLVNSSKVGAIFSDREGACYSSSEYLLCGLPVLSIASIGGRDEWYTKDNSIIVEKTQESVSAGLKQAIENLNTGRFNMQKIRDDHIQLSIEMRDVFKLHVQSILKKYNIDIDINEYFDKIYHHKMIDYGPEISLS